MLKARGGRRSRDVSFVCGMAGREGLDFGLIIGFAFPEFCVDSPSILVVVMMMSMMIISERECSMKTARLVQSEI